MSKASKKPAIVMTRFPYESSWGGEESHTINLARYLRDQGNEVIFMGSCPILLERFQREGFETKKIWGGRMIVTPLELLKSFLLFPFMIWSLRRAFQTLSMTHNISALYCLSLNEKCFLTPLALRQNIPVTWVEHQEIRSWLTKNPWKWLYKKYARQVKIVPISKKNEHTLRDELGIPTSHLKFIINGIRVDESLFEQRKTQPKRLVAANRFISKKGLMDFLKAIQILSKSTHNLEVMLIGEGEEEKNLKAYIDLNLKNENVTIKKFLKNEKWKELLSTTDVYVSCARDSNETFSLSTAEALASGCKVVVTKCSGIADFLEDGKEAIICEPDNPQDLADAIKAALSAPESMRANAHSVAIEKFDQQKMHHEYQQLIFRHHE